MEWEVIRSAFIRARGGRKQEEIAEKGDLHQSAISKLENNDRLGPAVEVFVKAIYGLGLTPSAFFAEIEHSQTNTDRQPNKVSVKTSLNPPDPPDGGARGPLSAPDSATQEARRTADALIAGATAIYKALGEPSAIPHRTVVTLEHRRKRSRKRRRAASG